MKFWLVTEPHIRGFVAFMSLPGTSPASWPTC